MLGFGFLYHQRSKLWLLYLKFHDKSDYFFDWLDEAYEDYNKNDPDILLMLK